MDKMKIIGGFPLQGTIEVSGAKNAALPILISSLLTKDACRYKRIPQLQDTQTTLKLLKRMGAEVSTLNQGQVEIRARELTSIEAPYDLVKTMRASVWVLGPLLARFGEAKVSLPGGCAIGARPINFHLTGLEKLGAQMVLEGGYVHARCARLKGAVIRFDFPSVGATANLMMAATLAEGETLLTNCAREPEIIDLAKVLTAMGAEIRGAGEDEIRIQGKTELHGCDFEVMGDRIEAGTFLTAAFATRGEAVVQGIGHSTLEFVLKRFEEAGAEIDRSVPNQISIQSHGTRAKAVDIVTAPFPGFPTDMQAQWMALMCLAEGHSNIVETVFENRFMHVAELARLGASISIKGNIASITGREFLKGAPMMATDLRASASLIIGALAAEGESIVDRIYHLDRGYERMELKLQRLGAKIERVK